MIPDRLRSLQHEAARSRIQRRVGRAAATGLFLLSACGSGNGAISPSTFVLEANNYANQTVTVGPVTANDLTPTLASYRIHGKKYDADQLGRGTPYLVALVPDNEQKIIISQRGSRKTVFLHGTILLRGNTKM